MIPNNITRGHILAAIREISQKGIPPRRQSKDFILWFEGKSFPPKYVISVANRYASSSELDPSTFSGGRESNDFLRNLGFEVSGKPIQRAAAKPSTVQKEMRRRFAAGYRHDERCPVCKDTVGKLLKHIYGEVYSNYTLRFGTAPDDFVNSPHYRCLRDIYRSLQGFRGHSSLVRTETLPPVDYYIPEPGLIVEFDESQHFTACRKLTLSKYPDDVAIGFSREEWMRLCDEIDARDNDPPYRDEQRAWYDTLRDFLPEVKGLYPTVRLYSKEMRWCGLDPDGSNDIEMFKNFIERRRLGVKGDFMAVVILQSDGSATNQERRKVLTEIIEKVVEVTDGDGVILLPGGYCSAGKRQGEALFNSVQNEISEDLRKMERNIIVCLGIDGRVARYADGEFAKDQLAVAIDRDGIRSIGRKFWDAPQEEGHVELASDHLSKEKGYSRIFILNGTRYFLGACYDTFGIKHKLLPNPGVDVILDLVHGFWPIGQGPSGHSYFARHGFAGASKLWKCPVFGAAVFFNGNIPESWPSGVYWNQGNKSTQRWCYAENPIKETMSIAHAIPEGRALIRVYDIQDCLNP